MNKKLILTLSLLLAFGTNVYAASNPFNYDLQKDMNRTRDKKLEEKRKEREAKERGEDPEQYKKDSEKEKDAAREKSQLEPLEDQQVEIIKKEIKSSKIDTSAYYYPNASLSSAINKYKNGNHTGCLQELFSLTKKDPSNPAAYYYMAMAYTQIGDKPAAIGAYDKVIALSSNEALTSYATRGKACLNGETAVCHPELTVTSSSGQAVKDPLDEFVESPYGNGLSEEVNEQMRLQELSRIQKDINRGQQELDTGDFKRLKEIENKEYGNSFEEKKTSKPTKSEVLAALDVLKAAGLTLSVQEPETEAEKNAKLAAQMMGMSNPQNQQFNEMSLLLGNNNNNNNNNMMMNMLPMMLAQNNGKNIDPQFMQTMMMQSMMPDLNFNNNNNNY